MNTDLSMIHLVLNASFVVQLVMMSLLVVSVMSWTIIFSKAKKLKLAQKTAREFEERFWATNDLTSLYSQITTNSQRATGLEGIFEAGFREFVRLRKQSNPDTKMIVDGSHRAMRVVLSREIEKLETNLSFLATVGSTSPYVGLFGTVWGIMNSFRALGNMQHVTIATVAPGIAEALIATAIGLFAAIPAVIAFNKFSTEVDRLINQYDTFLEEFSSILQRQAHQ